LEYFLFFHKNQFHIFVVKTCRIDVVLYKVGDL